MTRGMEKWRESGYAEKIAEFCAGAEYSAVLCPGGSVCVGNGACRGGDCRDSSPRDDGGDRAIRTGDNSGGNGGGDGGDCG